MYVPRWGTGFRDLLRVLKDEAPNLIYLNSFFDPTFTLRTLFALRIGLLRPTPVILAPRGEFSDSALRIGLLKKNVYLNLLNQLGLMKKIIWQASSKYERSDIEHLMQVLGRRKRVVLAPNISEAIDLEEIRAMGGNAHDERPDDHPLRVCFLSRVAPMKNLDFALRTLAMTRADIEFTIYGPKESATYWQQCESLMHRFPANVKGRYAGAVAPDEVIATLA